MDTRTPDVMRAQGIAYFRGYGAEDVLLVGYPDRNTRYEFEEMAKTWHTTPADLQAAYEQGRQAAEQEKQRNPVLFYLNALLKDMLAGDEWYGSDFAVPIWIVQQIMLHIARNE
jgi:hypothetical protein